MEQEQEADLVFRRVRVIDENGMVLWVDRPLPVGTVKSVVASGDSSQEAGLCLGNERPCDVLAAEIKKPASLKKAGISAGLSISGLNVCLIELDEARRSE